MGPPSVMILSPTARLRFGYGQDLLKTAQAVGKRVVPLWVKHHCAQKQLFFCQGPVPALQMYVIFAEPPTGIERTPKNFRPVSA